MITRVAYALGTLVVAAVVGVVAMTSSEKPTVDIALNVSTLSDKDRGEIMRDGVAIARIEPGWPGRVQLKTAVDLDSAALKLPVLAAALTWPCGERLFPLRYVYDPPLAANLRDAVEFNKSIEVGASVDGSGYRSIIAFVDNRDRPESTMSVGQYRFSVAAGAVERITLPIEDTCAEGRQLRMVDEPVAEFPAEQSTERDSRDGPVVAEFAKAFLIDPTGKRCYEQRFHQYADTGSSPYGSPLVYGLRADIKFSGGHVHALPEQPSFLFEDVPKTITRTDAFFVRWFDRGDRSSLHDLGCATE